MTASAASARLYEVQCAFLSILPRILLHGRIYFRHVRCPHRRDDCVAETVALAWKWFLRLAHRGKDPTTFPTTLAVFAARAVGSGRRVSGMEPAKDVLSPAAQARHDFLVERLPEVSTLSSNPFHEALADNTRSPVPDQVAFRSDFPAWRLTRTERDRRLLDDLMLGERTLDASRKFGLSPSRVSQLRREFRADWRRFCDGLPAAGAAPAPAVR